MTCRSAGPVLVFVALTLMAAAPAAAKGATGRQLLQKVTRRVQHAARKVREMPRPDRTLITATRLRRAANQGGWRPARLHLDQLRPVHGSPSRAIERKVVRRASALGRSRDQILANNLVDARTLDRRAPSVAPIRVVRHRGNYYVMDGNSRVRSLRRAFPGKRKMTVEVHVQNHPSPTTQRLLDRLLEQRGLR